MDNLNFIYFFLKIWCWFPYRIDSIAFYILDFQVKYYGLSYLLGIFFVYFLLLTKCTKNSFYHFYKKDIDGLMIAAIIGMFIGGRLGYVFLYGFKYYSQFPSEIFLPIRNKIFIGFSGMSYHGGFFGGMTGVFLYTRYKKLVFLDITDFMTPGIPIGCFFGRIGNFMNGELYGQVTNLFLGMYFPEDGKILLRHPSQLYEAFFEGLILFLILYLMQRRTWFKGKLLFIYLIGYGFFRFVVEYYREPDYHIGLIMHLFSLGQILSITMIILGSLLYFFSFKN